MICWPKLSKINFCTTNVHYYQKENYNSLAFFWFVRYEQNRWTNYDQKNNGTQICTKQTFYLQEVLYFFNKERVRTNWIRVFSSSKSDDLKQGSCRSIFMGHTARKQGNQGSGWLRKGINSLNVPWNLKTLTRLFNLKVDCRRHNCN